MKTCENIFTKITVVSLSVLYLFIALTYVLFLPNYNTLRAASKHVSHSRAVYLPANKHVGNNADRAPLFQKVFKTIIQPKKGFFVALLCASVIVAMAIMATCFQAKQRTQFVYAGAHRYTYLQIRTLRI
ncbi:MAG: hypothetical protein ACHQHN_14700 [Sphingobacteriales bacterium]